MKKLCLLVTSLMCSFCMCFAMAQTSHHVKNHDKTAAMSVVNVNTATTKELVSLKGIGEKKAQAIVNYRKQHGAFKSIDDLSSVRGISTNMLKRIEKENLHHLTVETHS